VDDRYDSDVPEHQYPVWLCNGFGSVMPDLNTYHCNAISEHLSRSVRVRLVFICSRPVIAFPVAPETG